MARRKSWREKLADAKGLPKIITLTGEYRRRCGCEKMVVPAPREVDELMRRVRRGRVATMKEICAALARKHCVGAACALTTGIFAWIAAHAAEEAGGGKGTTPYWRTLKTGGEVNPKYPGGVLAACRRLRSEGHRIVKKGSRYFVADLEKCLTTRLA